MVTIVDYGSGNLRSVQKSFERLGTEAVITSDPDRVATAAALVLPGVGAFGDAMRAIHDRGLVEPIQAHVRADRPFLGICMGLSFSLRPAGKAAATRGSVCSPATSRDSRCRRA